MTKALQTTLYAIAAYLTLLGVLSLLAPHIVEQITQVKHDDAMFNLLYGQYALTFALVALMAARAEQAKSKSSLAILILTTGHVIVFSYLLATSTLVFEVAIRSLALNSLFTALLLLFRREKHRP